MKDLSQILLAMHAIAQNQVQECQTDYTGLASVLNRCLIEKRLRFTNIFLAQAYATYANAPYN